MTRVEVIVFDIDDTLYLERDYVMSGFNAVGAWLETHHGVSGFAATSRAVFSSGRRGDVFDVALARLGVTDAAKLIPMLVDVYRRHAPRIELLTDARTAIEQLHPSRRLACITDGPVASQSAKARALGIEAWMSPIVMTDHWGTTFRKPHERAFREVERVTGASGAQCMYVADHPTKDFIAPLRLGWRVVRVRRPESLHAALATPSDVQHEIADLSALMTMAGERKA